MMLSDGYDCQTAFSLFISKDWKLIGYFASTRNEGTEKRFFWPGYGYAPKSAEN